MDDLNVPLRTFSLFPHYSIDATKCENSRSRTSLSHHPERNQSRTGVLLVADSQVRVLAYCLMTNHVHLVVVPGSEDSLTVLFARVNRRFAQAVNIRKGRSGHLWQ